MGRPNLRLRREIRGLFRSRRVYRGRWLHMRAGYSVSDRILISVRRKFGGAVLRNRARRRIRAVCRELGAGIRPGRLVLISLGDHARRAGYGELREDLISAFDALGLIDR